MLIIMNTGLQTMNTHGKSPVTTAEPGLQLSDAHLDADSVDANNDELTLLEITDDLKGKQLIRGVVSYLDGYGTK